MDTRAKVRMSCQSGCTVTGRRCYVLHRAWKCHPIILFRLIPILVMILTHPILKQIVEDFTTSCFYVGSNGMLLFRLDILCLTNTMIDKKPLYHSLSLSVQNIVLFNYNTKTVKTLCKQQDWRTRTTWGIPKGIELCYDMHISLIWSAYDTNFNSYSRNTIRHPTRRLSCNLIIRIYPPVSF